jgi:hypothetical protein
MLRTRTAKFHTFWNSLSSNLISVRSLDILKTCRLQSSLPKASPYKNGGRRQIRLSRGGMATVGLEAGVSRSAFVAVLVLQMLRVPAGTDERSSEHSMIPLPIHSSRLKDETIVIGRPKIVAFLQ